MSFIKNNIYNKYVVFLLDMSNYHGIAFILQYLKFYYIFLYTYELSKKNVDRTL